MVPFLVFLLRLPCRDGPLWIWCLASPAGVLTPRNPVLGSPRTFFRRVFGIFSRGRNAPFYPAERAAPQTLCVAGFPGNALIQSSRDFALGIPKEELAGRLANHGGQRISCRTHPDPEEPALSPDLESPHRAPFIPKMEFPGRFLALLELFVVQKNRASAEGSGPQAGESASIFTARNSKSAEIPGVQAKTLGGGELFEKYGTPEVCASACAGTPLELRFSGLLPHPPPFQNIEALVSATHTSRPLKLLCFLTRGAGPLVRKESRELRRIHAADRMHGSSALVAKKQLPSFPLSRPLRPGFAAVHEISTAALTFASRSPIRAAFP